jgi:hypothetical protein
MPGHAMAWLPDSSQIPPGDSSRYPPGLLPGSSRTPPGLLPDSSRTTPHPRWRPGLRIRDGVACALLCAGMTPSCFFRKTYFFPLGGNAFRDSPHLLSVP